MLAPWLPPQGYEARPSGKTWCQGWESGHWWVLVGWVVSGPLRPRQMPIFSNDADHVTSRQAVSGTRPRDTGQAPRPGGAGLDVSQHIREEAKTIVLPGKAADNSFAPSFLHPNRTTSHGRTSTLAFPGKQAARQTLYMQYSVIHGRTLMQVAGHPL